MKKCVHCTLVAHPAWIWKDCSTSDSQPAVKQNETFMPNGDASPIKIEQMFRS